MAHNWMEEVACTVKDVQNGINSLRNMHPFLTPSLKITSGEISEKGQQERSGIEQLNRTERYR